MKEKTKKLAEMIKDSWSWEFTMLFVIYGALSLKEKGMGNGICFRPLKTAIMLGVLSILVIIACLTISVITEKWASTEPKPEDDAALAVLALQVFAIAGECILSTIIMVELALIM